MVKVNLGNLLAFRFLNVKVEARSLLLFIVGVCWILVFPSERFNKRTYISENALLPGQVRHSEDRA